jgi:hypothetical protein
MNSLKKSKKIRRHKGGSRSPFNIIAKYEDNNNQTLTENKTQK